MNKKAHELGLQKTRFANSHGLANHMGKSCCSDIALLCDYAMKNSKFASIVSCKSYRCNILTTALIEEE